MNFVTFFISSNSQIPQSSSSSPTIVIYRLSSSSSSSSSSSLVLLLITTYHSLLSVSMLLFIIAFVVSGALFTFSPLGNNVSFTLCPHHTHNPHVFPKLHTYTHLAPSGLPQCPKQTKGFPLSHRCAAPGPAAVDTDHLYDAAPRAATGRDCTHCTVISSF
jgi:hypothetical protein